MIVEKKVIRQALKKLKKAKKQLVKCRYRLERAHNCGKINDEKYQAVLATLVESGKALDGVGMELGSLCRGIDGIS